MANLFSAKKRIKQNETRRLRNRARKSVVKNEIRKLLDSIHEGDLQLAKEQFQRVTKILDQNAAKGTFHKNTVSRKKSSLARKLNDAAAKATA